MDKDFDITYEDLNPTIFYACKNLRKSEGKYHKHDYTEIFVMLSGRQKFFIEDEEYEVETGDVIVCNAGELHRDTFSDSHEPALQFVVGFTDYHFRGMQENEFWFPDRKHVLHTQSHARQMITSLCFDMASESCSEQVGRYFMQKSYLVQLLLWLVRANADEPVRNANCCTFESYSKTYSVKTIRKYLEEHYDEKISLDQISKNMYLSSVYISKIFKEETGETPINYLIKLRLDRAKELLTEENAYSIKEVAIQVGYDDVYHFSKLFKKYYGTSPLHYKKAHVR